MHGVKHKDEEVLEWYKFFKESRSLVATSKKFSISRNVIYNRFNDLNLPITRRDKYSFEEVSIWYDEYKKYNNLIKTSNALGVSVEILVNNFKKYNLKTKPQLIYDFDEDFFSKETPESFYWAGFLAADGCVYKDINLTLKLSCVDHEILEKFKKCLMYNGPIRVIKINIIKKDGSKRNDMHYIKISSRKMCDDLKNNFGIGPRKSFTYSIPENVKNHNYVGHFLRGIIDGDGSVGISERRCFSISLCGSFYTIADLQEIVNKKFGIETKINADRNIYATHIHGENAKTLVEFIYADANGLCLQRKFDIAHNKNIKTMKDRRKPVIAIDMCTGQEIFFESIYKAKRLGFNNSCVKKCCEGNMLSHKGFFWKYANINKDL